jgi:cytochrome P450
MAVHFGSNWSLLATWWRVCLFMGIVSIPLTYAAILLYRRDRPKRGLRALPQPPRNLFGGHEGKFDSLAPFIQWTDWAHQLGPIYQIKVGLERIVVVSDPRLAKELFEKRGSRYSGRLSPYIGSEILSQNRRVIFESNGPRHTAYRRQIHALLSISNTQINQQIQELESRQALHETMMFASKLRDLRRGATSSGLKGAPQDAYEDVRTILRRYALSVMMTLSFSHRVRNFEDPLVTTVFHIMEHITTFSGPGANLVDAIPFVKHLPSFVKLWEKPFLAEVERQWAFLNDLLRRTENQVRMGVSNSGLIATLIKQRQGMSQAEQDAQYLDDKSIGYQAMTLMEAGAETTSITLYNFVLLMATNPRVMYKAQQLLDDVVPSSRLPSFEDLASVPYINQIAKEVIRFRPALPVGGSHKTVTDDEVDGYYIPAGSALMGNAWAMQHDPAHYANPEIFEPERFEGIKHKSTFESSLEKEAMDRDHYVFGWGRRICPGMHLAEASVLLVAARLLWAFDIVPDCDDKGEPLPVTDDVVNAYEHRVIASPKTFPVNFRLRSEERGKVIEDSFNQALTVWNSMCLDLSAGV